jgi:hypothetical protein
MKFRLLSILAIGLLIVFAPAQAGKGGPIAEGFWQGAGQAIYPDGTFAEITRVEALLFQDGNFIYGGAEFEVIVGDSPAVVQQGQMSAHMMGNKIKGVLGGCFGPPPEYCLGAGTFEGKLSGNKMTGTMLDLSDGSTSYIVLRRAPN